MFGQALSAAAGIALGVMAIGCEHHEPPTPEGSPSVALPEVAAPAPGPAAATASAHATATRPATATATASVTAIATASATATATASATAPSAADASHLPQTHDRPEASGPAWDARVAALWGAIVADDPTQAMPFFFPLGAYEQVKDVGNPAADWKHRLVAAYKHDIHELHARLGDSASEAKLVGLEVPEARGRWVDPGEEYNKLGYYRVFGSKLRYTAGGQSHTFDVKSLISWRGEWFVVHLSAIQ